MTPKQLGHEAYIDGIPLHAAPFEKDTEQRKEWRIGWLEAMRAEPGGIDDEKDDKDEPA